MTEQRTPPVAIHLRGSRGEILVDGVDIANHVAGLRITGSIHQDVPELELTVRLFDYSFTAERAIVTAELEGLGIRITGRECACDDGCTERENALRWLLAEARWAANDRG